MKYLPILFLCLFLGGCTSVSVNPGQEAVLVAKPMFFGHGGVVPETVKPGRTYAAWTTSYVIVNTTPIKFDEDFNDIMPKDNNPVDYHATVRLQITDPLKLVTNYGVFRHEDESWRLDYNIHQWYVTNIQKPFQTMNRNQFRMYSMPELALSQEVVQKVETDLEKELGAFLEKNGLPAKVIEISLGRISPQKEIIAAYNETGVQQQRAKTESQRANAERSRKEAETARAEADRAYQNAMGLSSDQYIRLQQIKMCGEKPNCSVFLGSSPVPMVTQK